MKSSIHIYQKTPIETIVKLEGSPQSLLCLLLNASFQDTTFASLAISACQSYLQTMTAIVREQQEAGEAVSDNEGVVDDLPF